MDCLVNLLGTRFDKTQDFLEKYKEDGIIWFLEACDLNVFAIRRAMWQMEEAGWFQYVKGFLIGRPLCFGQEMMGLDQYQAVLACGGREECSRDHGYGSGTSGTHDADCHRKLCGSTGTGQ